MECCNCCNDTEFLNAARRCPNYCIGLNLSDFGYIGDACWTGKAPCKLFQGLFCAAFARMNPSLFHPISEPTKPGLTCKTCECGTAFIPGSNRQTFCDECSTKRRKAKQREYLKHFRKRKHLEVEPQWVNHSEFTVSNLILVLNAEFPVP